MDKADTNSILRRLVKILMSVRFWFVLNSLALLLLLIVDFGFMAALKKSEWWPDLFSVLTNLLTGGIISFLFYF